MIGMTLTVNVIGAILIRAMSLYTAMKEIADAHPLSEEGEAMSYTPRRWKLAKQLCREMKWSDDWRVWTQALNIKKLEQLLIRLGIEPAKEDKRKPT